MYCTQAKKRTTCDRCRAHKLRCHTQPQSEVCDRCVKAETPCIFGYTRRGLRPSSRSNVIGSYGAQSTGQDPHDQLENGQSTGSDHLAQQLSDAHNGEWRLANTAEARASEGIFDTWLLPELIQLDSHGCFQASASNNAFSANDDRRTHALPGHDTILRIRDSTSSEQERPSGESEHIDVRLANLALRLCQHSATVPAMSIYDDPSSIVMTAAQYSLEQSFHVTQDLNKICRRYIESIPVTSSLKPQTSHRPQVDKATMFQLMSCHEHVISIWRRVWEHTRRKESEALSLPCVRLRMGNFEPLPDAISVPLEITLAEGLLRRVQSNLNDVMEATANNARLTEHASAEDTMLGLAASSTADIWNNLASEHKKASEKSLMIAVIRRTLDAAQELVAEAASIRELFAAK